MTTAATTKPTATKKILVIEDDGELGLVLDIVLQDERIEMDYVKTLLSAEEYLQKEQPTLIILDNKLPDGFGVDFIIYIRKNYPAIKIIMISGFGIVRDVALANGADEFFEKPFALDEFNEAINRLL
jgi:two-component system OmpR family response regulator